MDGICLVTGGAGFIGSHLVASLVEQGRRVRVLDDFSTGQRSNLAPIESRVEIITGDLGSATAVDRAVLGVETIFHLGAVASVPRSIETPLVTHQACATGTLHVLDAARRLGVRRVVYAASSSAYGGVHAEIQRESDPIRPLSPYAAAKLTGELYASAFAASYALETVSLRFFNIFGPRQRDDSPYTGVIALFCSAMLRGRRPIIYGDGLQSRDFTYVGNVVQALQKAAIAEGVSGKVYNVGTGSSITVLDLLAALNRLLGARIEPEFKPPRTGDVRSSRADISRARQELGYDPRVSFEEGLAKTLEWYRARG